jgi:hypothetical protein
MSSIRRLKHRTDKETGHPGQQWTCVIPFLIGICCRDSRAIALLRLPWHGWYDPDARTSSRQCSVRRAFPWIFRHFIALVINEKERGLGGPDVLGERERVYRKWQTLPRGSESSDPLQELRDNWSISAGHLEREISDDARGCRSLRLEPIHTGLT